MTSETKRGGNRPLFERNLVHVEIRVEVLVDLAFRLVEMGKMIIKNVLTSFKDALGAKFFRRMSSGVRCPREAVRPMSAAPPGARVLSFGEKPLLQLGA